MRALWAGLFLASVLSLAPGARADSFSALSAKAEKALKRGDSGAALEYYTTALKNWKKSDGAKAKGKAYRARADLYERDGEFDQALEDLGAALKLEPKSGALHRRRGELYLRLRKPDLAISDFYKAASVNLEDKDAYFGRGMAYEMQGDMKFAAEDFRTACRLGMKKACGNAAEAKKRILQPLSESPLFEEASERKKGGVEIKKARAKRRYTLDYDACLASLDRCLEEGGAFGSCVSKTKTCEREPGEGCCPEACVKEYDRLTASDRSEAEAFREVFKPKAGCAAP